MIRIRALRRNLAHFGFLIFCFSAPLLLRVYALEFPFALKVDEAEWTVDARSIASDWVVWRSTDLNTSGPLNGLAVSWPYLFGLLPSLFTSRLTGLLLQSLATLGIANLVRRGSGLTPAHVAALVPVVFLAMSPNYDYIHYSSELVSLLLIVAFCSIYARTDSRDVVLLRWATAGLLASCLPFAKLQSSLYCMLFHAFCTLRLIVLMERGDAWRRPAIAYIAGSALPVLILVVPPFLVGEENAFLLAYLGTGAAYGGIRDWRYLKPIASLILVLLVLMLPMLCQSFNSSGRRPAQWDVLLLGIALWPVTLLTIWLPGRPFSHYMLYGIFVLPLGIAVLQHALCPMAGGLRRAAEICALGATTFYLVPMVIFLFPSHELAVARTETERRFQTDVADSRARRLFDWTGVSTRDSLLMWGWEPQLTEYAGLRAAGRSAHAFYWIAPTKLQHYFRARLLHDLSLNPPALVLDTVRPGYFFVNYPGYDPAKFHLGSFPALYGMVESQYEQLVTPGQCGAVYLRRDMLENLHSSEIPLKSTAKALVDGSITENCQDWWAPDKDAAAVANLSPAQPEAVRELWILASRGGEDRDRGSTKLRVTFVSPSGVEITKTIKLFDYPAWTVLRRTEQTPVAAIRIEALEHVGVGNALNEVKAFRKEIPIK
jgi:hypothetical protein